MKFETEKKDEVFDMSMGFMTSLTNLAKTLVYLIRKDSILTKLSRIISYPRADSALWTPYSWQSVPWDIGFSIHVITLDLILSVQLYLHTVTHASITLACTAKVHKIPQGPELQGLSSQVCGSNAMFKCTVLEWIKLGNTTCICYRIKNPHSFFQNVMCIENSH